MNGYSLVICIACLCSTAAFQCLGSYPTIELAEELFSPKNMANPDIDFYRDKEYNEFLNLLWEDRHKASEDELTQMKNFLLMKMTSIVVRVSTNVVDDGTALYTLCRGREEAFASAFRSFGDAFKTNITDCLSIASYLGRVRTVSYPEDLVHIMASVCYVTKDAEKRREWDLQREAWNRKRELQRRVWRANDRVKRYRKALFGICNSCVLANRRVMDDDDFFAFTNRVVELSKPDDNEKRRLFDHLDEVKRK